MKKNIQINLFGTLYNIDEDAYQLLDNYLESMKRYFSRQEGGSEIADDIEHRVAELLWAKKEAGMDAVNNDVIREIITQIGNPEEISDGEQPQTENTSSHFGGTKESASTCNTGSTDWKAEFNKAAHTAQQTAQDAYEHVRQNTQGKKLFRNPNDKILGGVCSGLSSYFGGDVVLWRIILAALFVLHGFGLLLYLILWIVVPVARTPEDRLRMSGQYVTPDSINSQILQDQYTTPVHHDNSGCFMGCFIVLILFLLIPMAIAMFGALLGLSGGLFGGVMGFIGSIFGGIMSILFGFPGYYYDSSSSVFWWGVVLFLLGIGLTIYCIIHHFRHRDNHMSNGARILFAIIILVCLLMGVRNILFTPFDSAPSWNWNVTKTVTVNDEPLDELNDEIEEFVDELEDTLEDLDSIDVDIDATGGNIHVGPVKLNISPNGAHIKVNKPKTVITN